MFRVQVKSGKIVDELPLENNFYLMQIFPEKCKTVKEWQKNLFACVDSYCNFSGADKYEIWGNFKKENAITSTKDLPLEQFPELLEQLQFYLLSIS